MEDLQQWYDRLVTDDASKKIFDEEEIEAAPDMLLADEDTMLRIGQTLKTVPRQKFLTCIKTCKVCCFFKP